MNFNPQWPTLRDARISQYFGENPANYMPGFPGHEGIDWAIPVGTPIYAVADGEVFYINQDPNASPYGIYVRMRHQGGAYETIYAHLSQVMVGLHQTVTAGHVIALSGNTGRSTGPHLHFTLKKQGASDSGETHYRKDVVDPLPYLQAMATDAPQPTPPEHTTLDVQVVSDVGLNFRTAPVVGDVIVRLPDRAILGSLEAEDSTRRKLGQHNEWLWVRASDGQVGYVAAWYLALPGLTAPASSEQPAASGNEGHRLQVDSPDEPLKLRQGPDTSQPILARLPHMTLLESLEAPGATLNKVYQFGQWLHVRTLAGQEGYVAAWYLRLPSESGQAGPGAVSFGLGAEAPEELRSWDPDDLQRIRGIGPKISALLGAVGIRTFRQLAALTPAQLKAVLSEVGIGSGYVETWPAQARAIIEA
jgi:hypothetical protein